MFLYVTIKKKRERGVQAVRILGFRNGILRMSNSYLNAEYSVLLTF